jgi:cephalosporin-C deacetylase
MPWFDMPLERLREYRTSTPEPDGLDAWWAGRLDLARAQAQPPVVTPHEPDLYHPFRVFDVEFSGANGDPVKAWFIKPGDSPGGPVVVKFIGYGGGRGMPSEHFLLPALGYSVLVMDTRGQGGRWTAGGTGDGSGSTGPENSQVMTRGISAPEDYYYTRLLTDAALAVDVARELAGPDAPIAVAGASQGGGLALATAALRADEVRLCHADVPFMCDFQRAITLAPNPPYTEIPEFLAENGSLTDAALNTLRYVDCALLARRITAPTLVSVGLMDTTCPPSTVFAAYNAIDADKDIVVYPYSGHSVPHGHVEVQLRHLRQHLPA